MKNRYETLDVSLNLDDYNNTLDKQNQFSSNNNLDNNSNNNKINKFSNTIEFDSSNVLNNQKTLTPLLNLKTSTV